VTLWRLFRQRYGTGIDGIGGLYSAGRFHREGELTVYFSEHPSTALLEILVRLTRDTIPDDFQLGRFSIPDRTPIATPEHQPDGWWQDLAITRKVAAEWRRAGSACLLKVPSVIVPEDSNLIFNPLHADARLLQFVAARPFRLDLRLLN
jgi:RES domain-containing protein